MKKWVVLIFALIGSMAYGGHADAGSQQAGALAFQFAAEMLACSW